MMASGILILTFFLRVIVHAIIFSEMPIFTIELINSSAADSAFGVGNANPNTSILVTAEMPSDRELLSINAVAS